MGSLIVVEAESFEEVQAFAKDDPYTIFGVFQEVTIHPFSQGGFKFQVQHSLKGDKVLYFNGFGDWENIGREYSLGDSPIDRSYWFTLKGYDPPDSKSHELPVALGVRT
ncbi:MAG: YciI family protein [Nitrospirales bacterium]